MKKFNPLFLLLCLGLVLPSCSSDDDNFVLTAQDVSVTIDEHPSIGSVLGTVSANTTNNVTYTLLNQSQANGISVNSVGEIIVENWQLLDYEVSPTYQATVRVSDGITADDVAVTIALNDIDDIEYLLSTSKANYQNANDGEWVLISVEEYERLSDNLLSVQRHGTTKTQYELFNAQIFESYDNGIPSNPCFPQFNFLNKQLPIPANNFIFAFRAYIEILSPETQIWAGFSYDETNLHLQSTLPLPNGASDFDACFVLKSNSDIWQTQNEAYLCFGTYVSSQVTFLSYMNAQDGETLWGANSCGIPNSNNFSESDTGSWFHYQGLSTDIKQW